MFGKFIDSSTVTGTQIRLDNEQYLRARNFANNADVSILKVTSTNLIEFKQIPYVEGQGRLALYSEIDGFQVSIDYLYGQISGVTSSINAIEEEIDIIQDEIDALQTASGNYALKDLSNLTPTAIPNGVDIVSDSATSFAFKTVAKTTGNTGEVNIFSGNNTGTGTTGIVDIASGDILNVSSSSDTGIAGIRSGETNGSGNTGNVNIYSGNNTGTGVSGNITISAGTTAANDATTGSVEIQSGFPFGVADSGTVSIHSHNSSKDSGDVSLYSGSASNSSGNVNISTGTASSGVTRGSIGLDGQNTTVFLTTTAASGLYSLFNVQQNSVGGSSFQVLHDAEESTNSVGIRIFNGSPTSGFSIKGWGQEAQNGGPFRFESTKAYPDDSVSTLTGGDFNILAQSTDNNNLGPFIPSRAAEISSGNVNIETANAYISGSGANANTGSINLTTGTPAGTGTRGNVNVTAPFLSLKDSTRIVMMKDSSDMLARFQIDNGFGNYGQLFFNRFPSSSNVYIGAMESAIDDNGADVVFAGAWSMSDNDGVYTSSRVFLQTNANAGFRDAPNVAVNSGDLSINTSNAFVKGFYTDANSGNISLTTGTPAGTGTRGSVNVDAYNMNVTPVAGQCFNVLSPSGSSLVAIHNQGFSIPDSPEILFNNIPQTSVATFQLYSVLNDNGATFYFSGTRINANDDGSYTGGTVNMTSGGEGYITPANASISSADFNISSANAFVSGSFTDANSGNINITTGNKEGSGTRGFISLAASYINANLAQIKNVADPTDPQDALTLNYFDNNIPSVAANNFYDLQLYNTYAPSYANGSQGVLDPVTPTNPRAGWYFKNTAGSPQKINWYFFDGTVVTGIQLQNFSAFAVMTFDSISEIPIMNAYTFPTGSGDIIPFFAHSRVVYSAPAVPSPVVGTKYLVYFGEEPDIFPYLPRIELTYNAVQSGGDQAPTELVSTASFSSDSAASANNVQWMVENLGINTPSFKAFFKLLIFPVFEESQDFYGSFYSSQTQDNLVPDIARAMTFNNTDEANGVSIVSNSEITFDSGGLYNIQFSAQFTHSNSSSQDIDIWLAKNGTNVPFTNSRETLAGQVSIISAWNFFVRVNAGDYVEIYWSSPSDDVIIEYTAAQSGPTRPETPSIILTVNKIIS